MDDISLELLSNPSLLRFLNQEVRCKLLLVSVTGAHAYGYSIENSPIELRAIHIEPTESLVGLTTVPRSHNWVGNFEGRAIDFSSHELGFALQRLLKGDGAILERILGSYQLLRNHDVSQLQQVTNQIICRKFFDYYRNFSRGILKDYEDNERRSLGHLLSAYRTALTGIHLLKHGEIVQDLLFLAKRHGLPNLSDVVETYRRERNPLLSADNPWINRLAKLHSMLEEAYIHTELPIDPFNPQGVETYLLDMRRRFFDAQTVQD